MELLLAERLAMNLRALRATRGMTQAQAAGAAKVPRATWAHLESGAANPTLQVIHRAAQALQVSIEELIAAPRAGAQLFRAGSLPARARGASRIQELLPDPLPGLSLERMELPPRASFAGVPHTPGTREYLACESGTLSCGLRATRDPRGRRHVSPFARPAALVRQPGARDRGGVQRGAAQDRVSGTRRRRRRRLESIVRP